MLWRWQSRWWVLGLGLGLGFALMVAAVLTVTGDTSFVTALPVALVAGAVFGAVVGPITARARRELFVGIPEGVPVGKQRAGARAARGGPIPSDPLAKQVAIHLLRQRLYAAQRDRLRQRIVFGLVTVLYIALGVSESRWWLLGAIVFAGYSAFAWGQPNRLMRRLRRLTDS